MWICGRVNTYNIESMDNEIVYEMKKKVYDEGSVDWLIF